MGWCVGEDGVLWGWCVVGMVCCGCSVVEMVLLLGWCVVGLVCCGLWEMVCCGVLGCCGGWCVVEMLCGRDSVFCGDDVWWRWCVL